MPYKSCPNCQKSYGVRTLKCSCGFEFRKKKPYKRAVPHKTKKILNKKKNIVKPKHVVKKSSKKFPKKPFKKPPPILSKLKPTPKPKISVVWTDLEKGDKIRVFKDSGPRMILSDGVEVCIGHYGVFTVHRLDLHGIHVYGKNGYAFLYMGNNQFFAKTGIKRIKHKIKKLLQKK